MVRAALVALVFLTGCVSTQMKGYVGKPVDELLISYGSPVNVIELVDGRRAYQFRSGNGSFVTPQTSNSTVSNIGGAIAVRTTTTPAMVYETAGCLLTFIAAQTGNGYVVQEYRVPKQLVC